MAQGITGHRRHVATYKHSGPENIYERLVAYISTCELTVQQQDITGHSILNMRRSTVLTPTWRGETLNSRGLQRLPLPPRPLPPRRAPPPFPLPR